MQHETKSINDLFSFNFFPNADTYYTNVKSNNNTCEKLY